MAGLDIGTSFIIHASESDTGVKYTEFRDAFYRMKPTSPIAAKIMEKGLQSLSYFRDTDGSFVIVGQDAINKAVERHDSARRPMYRGVLSPREPDARRVLKFILSQLVGQSPAPDTKLVYSVPAQPIDQLEDEFDIGYHEDVLRKDLSEMGWLAEPLNEAEAICYSELENEDYTGLAFSFGSGMINTCLMSNGEAILRWSLSRSGDWLDRMAAQSTAQPDSVIQVEKEAGGFSVGQESDNPILSAVSSYYIRLIDYATANTAQYLTTQSSLPKFAGPIPVIVAGGTSKAAGFLPVFQASLLKHSLPIQVKEVRYATDPLRAVSRGCLIASSL